jgi:hypothetical protein
MAKRSRRSLGPVSRLGSPISRGLKVATRAGSRVLGATNRVWRTVGNNLKGVFNNSTNAVNGVLSNVTGRRRLGGRRGGKKNKTRKVTRRRR